MISFIQFLIENNALKAKTIPTQEIPKLKIYEEYNDSKILLSGIVDAYNKEASKSTIRNQNQVFLNILRHVMTNYDKVKDAITKWEFDQLESKKKSIPIKQIYQTKRNLILNCIEQLNKEIDKILINLPNNISFKDNNKNTTVIISKKDIQTLNDKHLEETRYRYLMDQPMV